MAAGMLFLIGARMSQPDVKTTLGQKIDALLEPLYEEAERHRGFIALGRAKIEEIEAGVVESEMALAEVESRMVEVLRSLAADEPVLASVMGAGRLPGPEKDAGKPKPLTAQAAASKQAATQQPAVTASQASATQGAPLAFASEETAVVDADPHSPENIAAVDEISAMLDASVAPSKPASTMADAAAKADQAAARMQEQASGARE